MRPGGVDSYAVGMTAHRVTAPDLSAGEKPKGPTSSLPRIEKTYGRPAQDWLDAFG